MSKAECDRIQFCRLLAALNDVGLNPQQLGAVRKALGCGINEIERILKRAAELRSVYDDQLKREKEMDDYTQRAKDEFEEEGRIEIDDFPAISEGFDGGVYVEAWVWVPKKEVEDDEEPSGEGGPPYDAATATGMYDRDF